LPAAERSPVTQFSILAAIARLGEAYLRQLDDTLAIEQTTLTRRLNLLEGYGVTKRVPHPRRAAYGDTQVLNFSGSDL